MYLSIPHTVHTRHNLQQKMVFMCDQCRKPFTTWTSLRIHVSKLHKEAVKKSK